MRRTTARIAGGAAVLSVLLGGAPPAVANATGRAGLRHDLAAQLHAGGGANGAWVRDLDARRHPLLFARRAHSPRILASNTKLFTTSAVLDRFGPKRRLTTRVWSRGRRTGNHDRVLAGDLALVGAGDPALASQGFADAHGLPVTPLGSLAVQVARSGIHVVRGDLLADDTVFDRHHGVPQTGIGGGPYVSPLSGLSYDSGFADGHFARDPAKVAGRVLEADLKDHGVRVRGRVRVRGTPNHVRKRAPLASIKSPTIKALVSATNKPSNNFFAEMLLKRLAARRHKVGTTARGSRHVEHFARGLGSRVRMENGSGLSRLDRSSPRNVGHLLAVMRGRGDVLRHTLPLAGHQGTLSGRMHGTAADGNCRAKTGTLDDASALSGYCRAHGHLIAFSILFNGVQVADAQHAEDRMAARIASYGR